MQRNDIYKDYDEFVGRATALLLEGNGPGEAAVWATLALAEATIIATPDPRPEVTISGILTVDS